VVEEQTDPDLPPNRRDRLLPPRSVVEEGEPDRIQPGLESRARRTVEVRSTEGETPRGRNSKRARPSAAPASFPAPSRETRTARIPPVPEAPSGHAFVAGWRGANAGDLKIVRLGDWEIRVRWCPPGSFKMETKVMEMPRPEYEDQGGLRGAFGKLFSTLKVTKPIIPSPRFYNRQVDVTLTRGFWIQETEMTHGLLQEVMGTSSGRTRLEYVDLPATNVSHDRAQECCSRLTELLQRDNQLPSGWTIALPTEAQWEYAARAGTTSRFFFGDDESQLGQYAWFSGNSGNLAHPVGTRRANPWGLYDMLGNVSEWCADGYSYELQGGIDPGGDTRSSTRVHRGGTSRYSAGNCSSSSRKDANPDVPYETIGFRLAAVQR
jgi:formylglycine-generating enzyme required for sulfatase activity